MLVFTLHGTPVILYGDELGMVDQPVPRERQRDYFGLRGGVSHDPSRTPMPWDAGRNGGFSSAAESALWLPVCHELDSINVAAQLMDPTSMLNLYRELLGLRNDSAALQLGTYAGHSATDEHCLVYGRQLAGESVGWLSSESDHLTLEPGGDLEPPLTEWGCLSVAVGPDAAGSE
jgi:alpha-glucosidase